MGEFIEQSFNYIYPDKFSMEDEQNRKLYINGEINEEIIDTVVYSILRYNTLDKEIPSEKRKPILLYINTLGGSVLDGFALIDAIRLSKTPIFTVNIGVCYSMGFLIFIAGKKRYSMPSATFLCHDGSSMAWDSMNKLKDRIEFETEQLGTYTEAYIFEQTKIPQELYLKNKRKEWYFYPTEAKELGVVDYIVGTDCAIDEIV